jgi:hypothetical protein
MRTQYQVSIWAGYEVFKVPERAKEPPFTNCTVQGVKLNGYIKFLKIIFGRL